MKTKLLCMFTLLLLFIFKLEAKPRFGEAVLFNNDWRFILGDVKDGASLDPIDAKWRVLNLPHDWSVEGTYSPDKASCTGYLPGGIGWYRKTFEVPKTRIGKKAYLYFEGVYNNSEVFINGKSVGKRPNGYVSFMYDLTPYIKYGEKNVISVKVDHSEERDSRWYTGSGIYRDTYLVYASPVHINLWGVYSKSANISDSKADIDVETTIKNTTGIVSNVEVTQEIIDPIAGKVIASQKRKTKANANTNSVLNQTLTLNKPKRWSLETPFLYTLRTVIRSGEKVIDKSEQLVGIRELKFDANNGFAINRKSTKIKGVCIHHDAGTLGSAVPKDVWKRRLETLKNIGCNAIRLSHNPQASDIYEICDDLGLLVMDEAFDEWEFAKRKWITGWNVGVAEYQGPSSFFKEWGDRDLGDIMLKNRSHPSIFMWSIGNEVDYPNDPYSHPVLNGSTLNQPVYGGYLPSSPNAERLGDIAKRFSAIVRKFDTSRPVTAALAGVIMSNETEYPSALDVAGYNYTEGRYDMDHKKYPQRVIYGSETGHSMDAWKATRDKDFVFGQFLWTGIDYLGESRPWPARGSSSGLLDFGGFLKPRGYFRKALWSADPSIYIGTYPLPAKKNNLSMDAIATWNYKQDEVIRVVCYSNAPKNKLLLNGMKIGETKGLDDNTGIIYWDLPYQEGKLEVVGLDNANKTICTYAIQSSESPNKMNVTVDKNTIKSDLGIAHITVQVVDKNGVPVMMSDGEISCTIEGPAKLLGLESSNNSDMTSYSDNVHRVYQGKILAYIQSSGEGDIKIKFSTPWLPDAMVVVKSIKN